MPEEKKRYLRKYFYRTLPYVRLILIGIRDKLSLFNKLPKDIYMNIIRLVIEQNVNIFKDDSLLLEI